MGSDENSTARLRLPFVSIVPRYVRVSVGFIFHYFLHPPSEIVVSVDLAGFFFLSGIPLSCNL